MVSPYKRQASTAVNSASSVSISDALEPLVRCRPQASATGPITAPSAAMATMRGPSARVSAASRSGGWRNTSATAAAPAYSNAAVVKAPSPCPKCCTKGVLRPNSVAASRASEPPLRAGEEIGFITTGLSKGGMRLQQTKRLLATSCLK